MTAAAFIRVNGQPQPCPAGLTVAALAHAHGLEAGARGVAVALNGAVVPRGRWGETPLAPGDTVDIVRAFQGG
ncbi:sulfur carrier protein [Azospirillum fermentarium]|uniref:sulfur carrier protein ThiS n=1 Tax=Azospirillum fermentarium TaxID=1233114 RepID=UPI002226C3FD|nr:sulfur carrier protein ThiS [Azospirillum fermentarium]MCW2244712.1 sulfur carrier protein [Azospirillum fermentarium]